MCHSDKRLLVAMLSAMHDIQQEMKKNPHKKKEEDESKKGHFWHQGE